MRRERQVRAGRLPHHEGPGHPGRPRAREGPRWPAEKVRREFPGKSESTNLSRDTLIAGRLGVIRDILPEKDLEAAAFMDADAVPRNWRVSLQDP